MSILTKNEIIAKLKELKPKYQKQHINKLGLFGSYSRDEAKEDSDIDIVFEIDKDAKFSMFKYLRLNKELEDIFNHKVDLVRESTIKSSIKNYIQKDILYV
jgi:predicted nucleotidyltransferase